MTKTVQSPRPTTTNESSQTETERCRLQAPYVLSPYLVLAAVTCFKTLLIHSYRSTDFEVHRNWLAVTHSLPLTQWYKEKTSEWTLDYPPFFAWFERLLAVFALYYDPEMLVVSNLNYASLATIRFQRFSVICTEFILTFAVMMFISNGKLRTKFWNAGQFAVFSLTVSNAGLIIVDHIHFQYNGFLLGILVLSMYFIATDRDLLGGIAYAILINFKHIYAYAAPLYFVYLLRHYCFHQSSKTKRFDWRRFVVLGSAVAMVFLISFGPFIWNSQLLVVLERLFPVKRGLTHAYWAPNFWAIYNALDRLLVAIFAHRNSGVGSLTRGSVGDVEHVILARITPPITLVLTLLAMAPVLISVWRRPHKEAFASALCYVTMASFMFGWHVHEKAILMVTIPLGLISNRSRAHSEAFLFLNLIANYSLIPLLFRPEEAYIRICLVFVHSAFSFILLGGPLSERWHQWSWMNLSYVVYILGLVFIQILMILQPFVSLRMEFLPLLLISCYCATGMVFCMIKLLHIHYFDSHSISYKQE